MLLAAGAGDAWRSAALSAAQEVGLPIDSHVLGNPEFADAYGITGAGAVLVRPDGVVGWRAVDAAGASKDNMRDVLTGLLCRNG